MTEKKANENQREIIRTPVENAQVIYVNSVELGMGVYDMRLILGQTSESTEERLSIKQLVTVIMSPQHAKSFAALLTGRIQEYEARFGPIPGA